MSEQTDFLKDLEVKPEEDNVFEASLEVPESDSNGEDPEESEMKLKNRRERRLAEKWQSERETNIALNARIAAISESKQLREGTEEADYLKRIERIFGNATPEAQEATELFKEALKGLEASATEKALERFESARGNEAKAIREEEQSLEKMLEELEDEYEADLTSDSATRRGFLTLLEKVSPKDKDGNIIEYADPKTVYELYESRKDKASSRAKDLASRSMTRSGASEGSKLEEDAQFRFLRENGII